VRWRWILQTSAAVKILWIRHAKDESLVPGIFTKPAGQRSIFTMKERTKEGRAKQKEQQGSEVHKPEPQGREESGC
jgi:hypothetical protein